MSDRRSPLARAAAQQERGRIITRAAVAAGLIVVLLAGLHMFEGANGNAGMPAQGRGAEQDRAAATPALAEALLAALQSAPHAPLKTAGPSSPGALESASAAATGPSAASAMSTAGAASPDSTPGLPGAAASEAMSAPLSARPGGRFTVRIGVFMDTAHAEALRASLAQREIPVQTETHVQLGPFATRAEAQQAQDALRKLGLEAGVLVAGNKR